MRTASAAAFTSTTATCSSRTPSSGASVTSRASSSTRIRRRCCARTRISVRSCSSPSRSTTPSRGAPRGATTPSTSCCTGRPSCSSSGSSGITSGSETTHSRSRPRRPSWLPSIPSTPSPWTTSRPARPCSPPSSRSPLSTPRRAPGRDGPSSSSRPRCSPRRLRRRCRSPSPATRSSPATGRPPPRRGDWSPRSQRWPPGGFSTEFSSSRRGSARRRWPALTFAALWYAVALAAEQTIFPLAEPVNEHRPYLAMLGLGTAAGLGLRGAAHLLARPLRVPATRVVVVLVALVAIALGVATAARNEVWRDDGALWRDAVAKAPANPRAWLNAGHAAMARDDRDEARRLLLEAHRLAPCYAYVQLNLSALASRTGDLAQSLRWADEAVACNPGFALTHYYRAMALERLGRAEEALAAYRRTTTIDAEQADAWAAQGRLLERQGAWAEAARAYERAVAANPTLSEPAMLAALLHQYRLRDPARAVELYRTVLRLVPSHYGAHYQLAVALLASGREPEARAAWRAFVPMAEAIGDRASIEGAPEQLRRP